MTITNATTEMSSYFTIATNYDQNLHLSDNKIIKHKKLTDEDNEKINDIFDDFEEDEKKLYTIYISLIYLLKRYTLNYTQN